MKNSILVKVIVGILACMLIVPLLAACSSGTPDVTTLTTPSEVSSTQSPVAATEVIKLKMASPWTPTAMATIEAQMLVDIINEKSQGKLEITLYSGESLGKAATTLDMLNNRICDMSIIPTGSFPNVFALYNGTQIPMMGIPSSDALLEIAHTLNGKGYVGNPDKYKVIAFNIPRPTNLWFSNKQVLKAEDFKGLKIRATDTAFLKPFEQFGITPISMPSAEVYSAIERGILDGATQTPENIITMKLYEVEKYGIDLPFAWAGAVMAISTQAYDKLPADLQAIVLESVSDFEKESKAMFAELDKKTSQDLKDHGVLYYKLDATEVDRWQKLYDANLEDWIAKREAEGLKGREAVDLIKSISQKHSN